MQKDNDASVLNSIYNGAKIGSQAISDILPKTENTQFRSDLYTQEKQYEGISNEAASQLIAMGMEPDTVGGMKKMGMKFATEINTIMNSDTSHLAELMIKGSNMGITNMTKVLNGYSNPKPEVKNLADRLIQIEQQNIDRLKMYLV